MKQIKDQSRRSFFRRLVGASAAVAVASSTVSADESKPSIPTPAVPATGAISWPCMKCSHQNATSLIVWPTMKWNLRCEKCGYVQHYALHLRKFDPSPTFYPGETGKFAFATPSAGSDSMPQAPLRAPEPLTVIRARLKQEIRARLARKRRPLPLPF